MDHKIFYSANKLFYFLFISLIITSCGSYQYSGYINDGIYQNSDSSKDYATAENQEINEKANNDYYQSAFSEKVLIYTESENSDQLFTDVENYSTTKNDSIQENYGPWGDYKDSVVINIHSYHHDGFWSRWRYPNWMWNYGYGYGGLNTWGYGYNNYWSRPFPFYGECMIPSTLFGDIMIRSIMDSDMVTDMHMVIILGGGHITLGTITTHMEETLIQMFHL